MNTGTAVSTLLLLSTVLGGCALPPPQPTPLIAPGATALMPRPARAAAAADLVQAGEVPASWWTLFGDQLLTELEQEAASANLDLQLAALRVEASRASVGLAQAARSPALSAQGDFTRSALSGESPLVKLGAPTAPKDHWGLGMAASWELDLWGYLARRVDAAEARLQASVYEREGARVSLAAELARQYILLRGQQARLGLLQNNRDLAQELLRLARSRERQGVATRFDSAAAEAELAGVESRLLEAAHQRDVLANALSLLVGRPPRELDERLAGGSALPMPQQLPVGASSELAHRRPDILRAEAQLRAAIADTGAAQADFYPRIRLSGRLGLSGFDASDLSHRDSREWAFGPSVHLPIFDGGRLRSNLELSRVGQQAAATAYRLTVLRAWHEVDDALDACLSERERQAQLALAEDRSQVALEVAQRGYQQGSADLVAVLVARRTLLASQTARVDGRTAQALAVVGLYRALGGGWHMSAEGAAQP